MITVMWNLSASIHGYTRAYMPSNVVIDELRRWRLKHALPTAFAAAIAYLLAMSLSAAIVQDGGPGWINALVIHAFWNAAKFAWTAILMPLTRFDAITRRATSGRAKARRSRHAQHRDEGGVTALDGYQPLRSDLN